jgi:murein L,D-transpeptidase YafK
MTSRIPIIGVLILSQFFLLSAGQFLDEQRKYQRFKLAEKEKGEFIDSLFTRKGLTVAHSVLYLRVFKYNAQIELWARDRDQLNYQLVRTYKICASSGDLGPKRRIGDGQVPEGAYVIRNFNPVSSFYLSLGLNYPNQSDRIAGKGNHLGGDIFIHGDCVTIGCMPIQDYFIKELYAICVYARDNGQKEIPVHIFPTRMDDRGMKFLADNYPDNALQGFWKSIRPIYLLFEQKHELPVVSIDKKGNYSAK